MQTDARQLALAVRDTAAADGTEKVTTGDMTEQEFRVFYSRTARPLRAYLVGSSRNSTLADDLLQESYYRLLRSNLKAVDEDHRRNYLFRIATNLLRDHFRRRKPEVGEIHEMAGDLGHGDRVDLRSDLERVLGELKPRDRQMLWLAYVEGQSHREIADTMGLKPASIRPMLFRARQRMIAMMKDKGLTS
jgi:RNA polymerase sigma-70 factor (ECF subfamily)